MRIFHKFIFAIFTFSVITYGQSVLTLDKAINIALHRNTTLEKSINNVKSSESNYKAAWGGLLPSINAQGSYGWNRSIQPGTSGRTYTFQGLTISLPATPSSTTDTYNYTAGVNSSWTLFDGLSNIVAVSQSKKQLESARLQLENLKQNIVFQTISLYYAVVNNIQLLKVKEDNVKWNKQNLETIVEKNKLGAVTLADVYAEQVQEGNAELDLIQTKNNLEISKSNLLYYLGLDVLSNYSFTDSLTEQEKNVLNTDLSGQFGNIDELVNKALASRDDYKSAELDFQSAQNGVTMAQGSYFPRLTNSFGYNLFANQLSNLSKSRTYSASLTLSIPIFEGFSIDNQVQAAEVNAMNKQVDLNDLRRTIKQNLQQTYLNILAAEKSLEVNKRNVASAGENQKITQEKYNLGSGTLLDVLVANSNYTNAQTSLINAEFQYIVLNQQLKYYLGVLNYRQYE
ncbi:MAG: TolC family protein [Ignavibacteriaceae bacterium]